MDATKPREREREREREKERKKERNRERQRDIETEMSVIHGGNCHTPTLLRWEFGSLGSQWLATHFVYE